jgi:hypothetical protein
MPKVLMVDESETGTSIVQRVNVARAQCGAKKNTFSFINI